MFCLINECHKAAGGHVLGVASAHIWNDLAPTPVGMFSISVFKEHL